jgi:hypothetical protein
VFAVCCHALLLCVLLQVCVVLLLALLLAGIFAWRGIVCCLLTPPAAGRSRDIQLSATTQCSVCRSCFIAENPGHRSCLEP